MNIAKLQSGIAMQLLMTGLWISLSAGLIINDFNHTHLLNPDWPPHARLHMMTLFTGTVAFTLFGLYLVWGPTQSRLHNLRLASVAGTLYMVALCVAALTMPYYGGSMEWTDTEPRAASLENENFAVFLYMTLIFIVLTVFMHLRTANSQR